MEDILNLIYIVVMFCSATVFVLMAAKWQKVPKKFFAIHIAVVLWSGFMYLNYLLGEPMTELARYLDWLITTPLLIIALGLSGLFKLKKKRYDLIFLAVFFQVITIVSGIFAVKSTDELNKMVWFFFGLMAMVGVFAVIWGPLLRTSKQRSKQLHQKYVWLTTYLTIQWIAYPIVWLISVEGFGYVGPITSTALFVIVPIISKAGFGFIDLTLLHKATEGKLKRFVKKLKK